MRRRALCCAVLAVWAAQAGGSNAAAEITPPPGLERFQQTDLPNGLRILLGKPQRTALFSEVLLVVRAGTGTAGPNREEVARVAAAALTAGRLGAEEPPIQLQLAHLGVVLDSTVGREVAVFRFAVPTRNTIRFLRLLADLLARNTLPEETWMEAVAQRSGLAAREQIDPWRMATAELDRLAWLASEGGPAPAAPVASSIEREALARFWSSGYTPERMVLSVWGELPMEPTEPTEPTEDIASVLRRDFGRLDAGRAADGSAAAAFERAPVEPSRAPGAGLSCLREEGAVPPALLVGLGTEVEDDTAFYGWQLVAHILGASYNSRLQRRLRTESQVVYTVEAACLPVGTRGLTLRIACQTDQVETARKVILEELQRLVREPVAQEELDLARALLRSRLQLDQASFRDQFYRRSLALLAIRGIRDPGTAEPVLAGLTPTSLLELMRKTLRPGEASTVLLSAEAEPLCEVGLAGR